MNQDKYTPEPSLDIRYKDTANAVAHRRGLFLEEPERLFHS